MPALPITIAIPFYTGLDYLRRAIESVRRQTVSCWELLVVDDGMGRENVSALVEGYSDQRIRYIRNEDNLGMAGNWNRCLDLAAGELVTLLHADDMLLENYAETMVTSARKHSDAVALFCRARIVGPDDRERFSLVDLCKHWLLSPGSEPRTLTGEKGLQALLGGNFIMCPTLCYRRAKLGARRFQRAWRFVLDWELTTRLLLEGDSLVGLPDTCYVYRRHADNATERYTQSLLRFQEEMALYRLRFHDARRLRWAAAARTARSLGITRWYLLFRIFRDCIVADWTQARRKMGLLLRMRSISG
jgi:glycosyltransferase involved in cell wall biosynthesis